MSDKTSRLAKSKLPWRLAPFITAGLFLTPIIVAVVAISLSGANILDGLFGVYRNTPFQAIMVRLAVILVLGSPILPLIFAIVSAVKYKDLHIHQRLASLYVFFGIIFFIVLLLVLTG